MRVSAACAGSRGHCLIAIMQREDVVSNASILEGILGSLSWQELCVASQVCSTWKQVGPCITWLQPS